MTIFILRIAMYFALYGIHNKIWDIKHEHFLAVVFYSNQIAKTKFKTNRSVYPPIHRIHRIQRRQQRHEKTWKDMKRHEKTMKRHEKTWKDMKRHGKDMKRHEKTWKDMKRHEKTWKDMKRHEKTWKTWKDMKRHEKQEKAKNAKKCLDYEAYMKCQAESFLITTSPISHTTTAKYLNLWVFGVRFFLDML